eukprot:CAMPEP_0176100068 /NCGR_PEP_ID=MMETSP0120_2-20121206/50189_1 /TAXON_ID=160619 /ORGANISM="Kryptoperidinium foliaceum, Strain CCMP 1326" /LENGTH=173 /DNA_ID=CAMNT_0017434111 /DNA_START=103 /DNA_END=624 /DNA_ORIENTATION=+
MATIQPLLRNSFIYRPRGTALQPAAVLDFVDIDENGKTVDCHCTRYFLSDLIRLPDVQCTFSADNTSLTVEIFYPQFTNRQEFLHNLVQKYGDPFSSSRTANNNTMEPPQRTLCSRMEQQYDKPQEFLEHSLPDPRPHHPGLQILESTASNGSEEIRLRFLQVVTRDSNNASF